ncbi:MAG: ribonuclease P protein component [Candidatus Nealsonbacteria bacterium CG10_big_fil_rev_8_21_14_0_10_36_228]|uniref:Ribonuclease P protein component n=4 Tax=Candidatus Nealsoniibacteriota TaxID=1817911 RepID=A0A2M8DLG4_9BACT|nr:MAG: ribonuclease P protein component [Candidatus Nealsonbacteria bacterium CG23_combo_of_CG06-09_8_20_14_all_36_125]PIR72020.1 MAG: ribonuclease P protein component [Candidatus Nealsonbacteria bacterium CG10_big_fil_rev_8_21_14_0_10_36_228]PIX88060.1 MAG: ribonuclease P protein component [Candidatus Nealsonbacteria bacterium CG_4_10_14_3_um_filter_36_16]PJB98630.1 MAG: ribonuclease P protein component [Candidatus Nealsonbacteria bacterium CG_4_9_14_0_8_um_filter_36_17]
MEINCLTMVPKKNRLQKKTEIVRVFKKGKGFKEDFLILKLVKNNLEKSRFSFIISQKVSKKATTRNKIKRRLSEIVRLKLKKIKKGIDVILIACPGLEEKDFWEIEESLDKLFLRANLYV